MTVKNLKRPGLFSDGAGLCVLVEGKSKTFVFRYKVAGKERRMGLGPVRDVSLDEAREAARDARRLLRQVPPIDPIDNRRAIRAEAIAQAIAAAAPVNTFDSVTTLFLKAKEAGWKSAVHREQWQSTINAYASPFFGSKAVAGIAVDDVLEALTPIWEVKPETASRVRGRIENVLDYAKTRGWRTGDNPARWRGHLDHLLPARAKLAKVEHHAALPYGALPGAMTKLMVSTTISALCLRFTILTASRSGEARGARWNEIDLAGGIWIVPAERMKAAVEHRVPLSDAAIDVLETMKAVKATDDSFVFPGGKKDKRLSDVAVSKALANVANDVTVHGMRSTFRDWAAECTAFPREVCEGALAHSNKDKVEAAYRRSDLLAQRAKLMQGWADFCTAPPAEKAEAAE
jgi:integrase